MIQSLDSHHLVINCFIMLSLLIHGKDDGFVPCRMSQEGFDACCGAKDILLVDGAEHGLSFVVDTDRYTKAVDAFIDANVGGRQ